MLLRSFSALAAGETAARALGFVAIIVMARRLTPDGFGIVAFGTALLNWFRIVVDSGTEFLAVRDVARTPARFRAIASPILGLRLALSGAAVALFVAGALLIPAGEADRRAVLLFALMLPIVALNLRWMVLGVDRAKAVALGNVASQVFMVVGVLVLVQDRGDALYVPLVMVAGEIAYALLVLEAVRKRFGLTLPRIELTVWRRVIREGLPLSVNNIARTALYGFDVLLIAVLLYRSDVGLYAAAYKPVMFGVTLVGLLSVSFLATYSSPGTDEARLALARRTALVAGAVAALGALVLCAGSHFIVTTLLGEEYAGAATPLAILAWTLPLLAFTSPYASALISANRQKRLMRNNLIAAGANVLGNLAAVPLLGIAGAACTTVASFSIVLVLCYRDATRLGLAHPVGRPAVSREREALAMVAAATPDRDPA